MARPVASAPNPPSHGELQDLATSLEGEVGAAALDSALQGSTDAWAGLQTLLETSWDSAAADAAPTAAEPASSSAADTEQPPRSSTPPAELEFWQMGPSSMPHTTRTTLLNHTVLEGRGYCQYGRRQSSPTQSSSRLESRPSSRTESNSTGSLTY